MSAHCTPIRVRYADTDQSGAVYHANYIVWFEAGRTEAMRAAGIPYSEVDACGINLPVVELNARYNRPVLYDQLIEVWTTIGVLTRTRVRFDYRIRLPGSDRSLVEAHTLHAFVSHGGSVLRMDRFGELWERVQEAARKLQAEPE